MTLILRVLVKSNETERKENHIEIDLNENHNEIEIKSKE